MLVRLRVPRQRLDQRQLPALRRHGGPGSGYDEGPAVAEPSRTCCGCEPPRDLAVTSNAGCSYFQQLPVGPKEPRVPPQSIRLYVVFRKTCSGSGSLPTDGAVSNKLVSLSVYPPLTAKEARQLTTSPIFVFDGSDQAPAAVGGDAEFTAFQQIIKDPDHYMDALQQLEDVAARSY